MFSQRSRADFEPNALSRALARIEESATPLLDLTIANPTTAGIPYDAERVLAALADPRALTYAPDPLGLLEARAAVAGLWAERGVDVTPERVLLTVSTSEAYAFCFKLLCDPGDEVLVPAPSYPLLEHLAELDAVRLVRYPLAYDGAWFVDLDAVRNARTERTRAVVVVSPNNPTGSYLKRGELERLAELGLPIVSDEVFAEYTLKDDPEHALSALETQSVLVLALDGLSKLAALPQVKLAWLTLGGPAPLVKEALSRLELMGDTFLSPSTAAQLALPELLATRRTAGDAIRARVRLNHERLVALCAGSLVTPLHLEGGWYAVLRLPATRSDEDWALALLDAGVSVHPGYFFDLAGPPHVVVSLLTSEPVFETGVERLIRLVGEQSGQSMAG